MEARSPSPAPEPAAPCRPLCHPTLPLAAEYSSSPAQACSPVPTVPAKPQVPKEDMDQKPVRGTKVDKDILACTVEQLTSRIVHKQVASGHAFKGQPFHSKPKLIHFKVSLRGLPTTVLT